MTLRSALPTTLLLAVTTAWSCGGPSGRDDIADTGSWDFADTDMPPDDDADPDTGVQGEAPSWWSLGGTLQLSDGEAVVEGTTIELATWADRTAPTCRLPAQVVALGAATPPPDVPLYGWWEIELQLAEADEETEADCDSAGLPTLLHLGLGALDPLLHPSMDANGYPPQETSAYGLYARPSGFEQVFVFGLSGREQDLDGTSTPVEAPPLPDGAYALLGLHLLPLER